MTNSFRSQVAIMFAFLCAAIVRGMCWLCRLGDEQVQQRRLTFRPALEGLEGRLCPDAMNWSPIDPTTNTAWDYQPGGPGTNTNWVDHLDGTRLTSLPSSSTYVYFDSAYTGNQDCTLNGTNQTVRTLNITNAYTHKININSGSNYLTAAQTCSIQGGEIDIQNGSYLRLGGDGTHNFSGIWESGKIQQTGTSNSGYLKLGTTSPGTTTASLAVDINVVDGWAVPRLSANLEIYKNSTLTIEPTNPAVATDSYVIVYNNTTDTNAPEWFVDEGGKLYIYGATSSTTVLGTVSSDDSSHWITLYNEGTVEVDGHGSGNARLDMPVYNNNPGTTPATLQVDYSSVANSELDLNKGYIAYDGVHASLFNLNGNVVLGNDANHGTYNVTLKDNTGNGFLFSSGSLQVKTQAVCALDGHLTFGHVPTGYSSPLLDTSTEYSASSGSYYAILHIDADFDLIKGAIHMEANWDADLDSCDVIFIEDGNLNLNDTGHNNSFTIITSSTSTPDAGDIFTLISVSGTNKQINGNFDSVTPGLGWTIPNTDGTKNMYMET